LTASKGSQGRIVSLEEFKSDFIRRMGRRQLSRDQQLAYTAHFAVVDQAMTLGLQYPIRFEKVGPTANASDLLLSRPQAIQLVDGVVVEKVGGGGNLLTAMFGQASPKGVSGKKIVWPPAGVHDQAKFTDLELAIIMSNNKPATWEDMEFVYVRYISTLPYHNLWYRLKQVVAEAAYDIIDTLHFRKHNHGGYSWKEVAEMIETNDPRKSLWYTNEQQEALVVAAQHIYRLEKEQGSNAIRN
jgi:hypothetical protein